MGTVEMQREIDISLDRQVHDFDSLAYTSVVSAKPDTFTEELTIPQPFLDAFSEREVIDEIETDENGRFLQPERPMDLKWSAFDQIWLGKEVKRPDGKTVYRIAAISIPKAAGSGHRMGEEGLRKTLDIAKEDVHRWKGDKEGTLIGMRKSLSPGEIDLSIIERFMENSTEVVARRHPFPDDPLVKEFFKLQEVRRENMHAIKERANRILSSDKFIGMAAMTEEQMGAGGFVLELEVVDGILWGADPKGKRQELRKMMIGKAHGQWGEYGETATQLGGNFAIGHGDSSEWVSDCNSSQTCSKFFDIMQQPNAKVFQERTIFINSEYKTLFILPTLALGDFMDREIQKVCRNNKCKGECICDKESNEVTAGGEN